jgi:hypothetical protein
MIQLNSHCSAASKRVPSNPRIARFKDNPPNSAHGIWTLTAPVARRPICKQVDQRTGAVESAQQCMCVTLQLRSPSEAA